MSSVLNFVSTNKKKINIMSINAKAIQQKSESAGDFICFVPSIWVEIEILSFKYRLMICIELTDKDIIFITKIIIPVDLSLTALLVK